MMLLDFDPKTKEQRTVVDTQRTGSPDRTVQKVLSEDVEKMVHEDVSFNLTPDLPELRYAGAQYLFIWDESKDCTIWTKGALKDLKRNVDYREVEYTAITEQHFVPFRNRLEFGGPEFYLPADSKWYEVCEDGPVQNMDLTSRPVCGKLFLVGLKAMRAFDRHYANTLRSHRVQLQVSPRYQGPLVRAHAYVHLLEDFSKYNPHKQRYTFTDRVSPMSVRTEVIQCKTVYNFNHLSTVGHNSRRVG